MAVVETVDVWTFNVFAFASMLLAFLALRRDATPAATGVAAVVCFVTGLISQDVGDSSGNFYVTYGPLAFLFFGLAVVCIASFIVKMLGRAGGEEA